MKNQLVRDWMTRDLVTISSGATLLEAHWLMVENSIRRLPVIDDGSLVGIVAVEDLRAAVPSDVMGVSPLKFSDMLCKLPIHQLMTPNPVTIAPAEPLVEAARLMLEHKISALPVVEAGKVVGIITESDIFRALVQLWPS
jgi:acetoin utilization protein AcuB